MRTRTSTSNAGTLQKSLPTRLPRRKSKKTAGYSRLGVDLTDDDDDDVGEDGALGGVHL